MAGIAIVLERYVMQQQAVSPGRRQMGNGEALPEKPKGAGGCHEKTPPQQSPPLHRIHETFPQGGEAGGRLKEQPGRCSAT